MVVECPSDGRLLTFATWFANIVEQSSPTKPQIVAMLANILKHLEGVKIVVFVCSSVAFFNDVEFYKLRQNKVEQSRLSEIIETLAWVSRKHYLV